MRYKIKIYYCECGGILGQPFGSLSSKKAWVECDECGNEYEVEYEKINITEVVQEASP